ncbi:c-type cytochrome [Roseinatronobacter monicus]|uniref:c-type cytochrome n=1 Tax=Roseinatronobacter monicus TaxID=393481 RepID=UPI003F3CD686
MNIPTLIIACAFGLGVATSAMAGEVRWRDCRTCHAVTAPDGAELARGGRSGPNLYGIANRPAASDSAFRFYSDDLRAAGAAGLRWTEGNFVAYLAEPDQFLQEVTGNPDAESGMHVQLRSGARELFEYLRELSN